MGRSFRRLLGWQYPVQEAQANQERAEGMRCVAAPVFNAHGEPVAGLSVSGPTFRMALSETARLGALVRAAADEVSEATGGRNPDAY